MTTIKQKIGQIFLPKLPVSREVFSIFRLEANALLLNLRNRVSPLRRSKIRKYCSGDDLLVNIGAGPFGQEGWVNLDMFKHRNIAFAYDCRRKLPFRTSSVKCIRCEHFFEHMDLIDEIPIFMAECLRVLKPGGILRIVVPDIEKFISAYHSRDPLQWKELGFDLSQLPADMRSPVYLLNHVFRQNGEHKFGYDFESLRQLLLQAGFDRVLRQEWQKSSDPLLIHDLANHRPYSLYVEAIKANS